MYVKENSDGTHTYPYTVAKLRSDNPNTSFPKFLTNENLEEFGIYKATVVEPQPAHNSRTQYVDLSDPVKVDNQWIMRWEVHDNTPEQQSFFEESRAKEHRALRDALLAETDWWALADSPTMTAEQSAYRQALRDITTHSNWPFMDGETDWPTKP